MLIHDNPAASPVGAKYKKRIKTSTKETLDIEFQVSIIFWDKAGNLENNQIGVVSMCKISNEQLPNYTPQKRDQIIVGTSIYIVHNVSLRHNNPVFDDFWEIEVKSKEPDPTRI
jgi:hypothetical protein